MNEKEIMHKTLSEINGRPDMRVFRNNVGKGFVGTEFKNRHELIKLLQGVLRSLTCFYSKTVNTILSEYEIVILKHPRRIAFGLQEGSGDLIGWKSVTVTPDMVGKKIAVFCSIELKTPTGRVNEEQKNWMNQVLKNGGMSAVIRDPKEAEGL